MIQRSPEERRRYDDRLKFERDEKARLLWAIEECKAEGKALGIAEGLAEGIVEGVAKGKAEEKMSMVHILENLLKTKETFISDMQAWSLSMLDVRIAELKNQLRNRIG